MRRSLGIGAVAAAASTVSGLIIPSTNPVVTDGLAAMAMIGVDPFSAVTKIDCTGCMLAEPVGDREFTWTEGVDTSLIVNATISEDMKALRINGARIYPLRSHKSEVFAEKISTLRFPQILPDVSLDEFAEDPEKYTHASLEPTAHGTRWDFVPVTGGKETMVTLTFRVDELEEKRVYLPEIHITLLKDQAEKLTILRMESKDRPSSSESSAVELPKCHGPEFLCKWRAALNKHISDFRHNIAAGSRFGRPGCKGGKGKGMMHHGPPTGHAHHPHGPPRLIGSHKPEWDDDKPGHHYGHHGDGRLHSKPHGPPGSHHGHHRGHHGSRPRESAFVRILFNVVVPWFFGLIIGFMLALAAACLAKLYHAVVEHYNLQKGAYVAIDGQGDDDDATVFDGDVDGNRKSIDVEKGALMVEVEDVDAPPAYTNVEVEEK